MIKIRRIINVNSITLPKGGRLKREAPRPLGLQQEDYSESFDSDTLFYDVFSAGDEVRLVGPPMLNLENALSSAEWRIDKSPVRATLRDLDRTQSSYLTAYTNGGEELEVTVSDHELSAVVSESGLEIFRGRRVLTTKSKNNDLQWVRDWAKFYAVKHDVDAVLLYDNGSDDYSLDDLLMALDHPEIDVVIVVNWPFKFGPQGGSWEGLKGAPWDSDFCEYGILEHARHRFLREASGVVSHDIDELAMASNGQTLFEIVDRSKTGYIRYSGRWIESVTTAPHRSPRFTDFSYYNPRRSSTTKKWALDPRRVTDASQWKTHNIAGVLPEVKTATVSHRHFMGISTNWKWRRKKNTEFDPLVHKRDSLLVSQLVDVFGPESINACAEDLVVMTPSLRAKIMENILSQNKQLRRGLKKIWYWKENTLVLDYISIHAVRYAFDVIFYEGSTCLQVTARDEIAWYTLRKVCGDYAKVVKDRPRHLQYSVWERKESDLQEVACGIVSLIQRTNTDLNSSSPPPPRSIPSYWWDLKENFGDLIGPWVLEELTARPVYNTIGRANASGALMTVGSLITHMQRPGMTIWGSGLIAPLNEDMTKRLKSLQPEAILAVRGKLTRSQIIENLGWEVPEVYGDPALLMPYLFEPEKSSSVRHRFAVIPHYSHKHILAPKHIESLGGYAINVQQPAEIVVDEIAKSDVVISTSLHGVILAQAYKIPWVWLRVTDKPLYGDRFNFEDFFTVLQREKVVEIEVASDEFLDLDLNEIAQSAVLPQSSFDPLALVEALPVTVREDIYGRLKKRTTGWRRFLGRKL